MKSKIIIEVEHEGELTGSLICYAIRCAMKMQERENLLRMMPFKIKSVQLPYVEEKEYPDPEIE